MTDYHSSHGGSVTAFLAVAGLTALGLLVRLHQLDFDSMFMDETRQASYYSAGFVEIVRLAASQTQPPLDYWIGRLFYLVSPGDYSLRMPSALFGSATVSLLTAILIKRFGILIGVVFGICLAVNPFLVYYSQEARPYASATFFCLLFTVSFYRLLQGTTDQLRVYSLFALITAAFVLTRTLVPLIFVLVASGICVGYLVVEGAGDRLRYRIRLKTAIVLLLVAMLYLPLFHYIYQQNIRFLGDWQIWDRVYSALAGFSPGNFWRILSVQAGPAAGCFFALAVVGILSVTRDKPTAHKDLTLIAWLFIGVILVHFLVYHGTSPRPMRPPYAFYLLPFLVLFSAAGLRYLQNVLTSRSFKRVVTVLLSAILVAPQVFDLWHFKGRNIRTDWRGLAAWAKDRGGPETLLLMESLAETEHWYPGFTGFSRYDQGKVKVISPDVLLRLIDQVDTPGWRPVLVLYHYREFKLRPYDHHGLLVVDTPPTPGFDKSLTVPNLRVTRLNGLSLVELDRYSGNLALDLGEMIDGLARYDTGGSAWLRLRVLRTLLTRPSLADLLAVIGTERQRARPSQQAFLDRVMERVGRP